MLCGKLPFRDDDVDILRYSMSETPRLTKHVSKGRVNETRLTKHVPETRVYKANFEDPKPLPQIIKRLHPNQ